MEYEAYKFIIEMVIALVFFGLATLEGAELLKGVYEFSLKGDRKRLEDTAPALIVAAILLTWAFGSFQVFDYLRTVDVPISLGVTVTFLLVTFISHNFFDLWKMTNGFGLSKAKKWQQSWKNNEREEENNNNTNLEY